MLITCKELAEQKLEKVKLRVQKYIKYHKEPPKLVIFANSKDAGGVYVRNKVRVAKEVGILCEVQPMPEHPSGIEEFIGMNYFEWEKEHSIIIQMPAYADKWYNELALRALYPEIDADGLGENPRVLPATAKGIIDLMEANDLVKDGNTVVVIGRSKLVGWPVLADLIQNKNMNVVSCNSKTDPFDLKDFCLKANVIITAAGVPNLITEDMVSPDTIILDVSINRNADGRLCGDVAPDVDCDRTPVPGGIGLLTVACLMENVCTLHGV